MIMPLSFLFIFSRLLSSSESPCTTESTEECLNFQSIVKIHIQVDEDHNGPTETLNFIGENLNRNESLVYTGALGLWNHWKSSEAYNWTNDQLLVWLQQYVRLPQYQEAFKLYKLSGRDIPRLATNVTFTFRVLGIVDPIARKRLKIMSFYAVLFGFPSLRTNRLKYLAVFFSIVLALAGIICAYNQYNKFAEEHLLVLHLTNLMEKNLNEIPGLSPLRNAERHQFRQQKPELATDMNINAHCQFGDLIRKTYRIEQEYIRLIKNSFHEEIVFVKNQIDKFGRKRSGSFFSSLKYGYFNSFYKIDFRMTSARKSADEINALSLESSERWREIKRLCGLDNLQTETEGRFLRTSQSYAQIPNG